MELKIGKKPLGIQRLVSFIIVFSVKVKLFGFIFCFLFFFNIKLSSQCLNM